MHLTDKLFSIYMFFQGLPLEGPRSMRKNIFSPWDQPDFEVSYDIFATIHADLKKKKTYNPHTYYSFPDATGYN